MKSEHRHIFITGLVYPAVLGTFLFTVIEHVYDISWNAALSYQNLIHACVVLALFLHYAGDYVYTTDQERKTIYGTRRMFLDLLLVALLYLAMRETLDLSAPFDSSRVAWLLAGFKVVCIVWERAGSPDKHQALSTGVDFIFLALYTLVALAAGNMGILILIVLLVDASAYFWWECLCRKLGEN